MILDILHQKLDGEYRYHEGDDTSKQQQKYFRTRKMETELNDLKEAGPKHNRNG